MKITFCFLILLVTSTYSLPVNDYQLQPLMNSPDFYWELRQEVGKSILLNILNHSNEAMDIPEDEKKANVFRLYY